MKNLCFLLILCLAGLCKGQDIYPIGDQINIGYKTSMIPDKEKILFEANPIVRLPVINRIKTYLESDKRFGSAIYFNFNPTIRMYDDNSKPVKTPSYKISLGYQQIIRLKAVRKNMYQFLAYAAESGHYSNGQSKCIFNKDLEDGSEECNTLSALITPQTNLSNVINRESGNFSTNFSELALNYRLVNIDVESNDNDYKPQWGLSALIKYTRFHNDLLFIIPDLGGYSPSDIKIYGKNRYTIGLDLMKKLDRKYWIDHLNFNIKYEYIDKPHESVNPSRVELSLVAYLENNLGLVVSGIFGHDNYNYRFVDSGTQFFVGITYDIFPPVPMILRPAK